MSLDNMQLLTLNSVAGDGAAVTYQTILNHINSSQKSINLHVFVWRSDEIGNQIGCALIAAADRGVKIEIFKDVGASVFELIEENGKPYFPPPLSIKFAYRGLSKFRSRSPTNDNYHAEAGISLLLHRNIRVHFVRGTHSKYFLFDYSRLVIGSLNIEDRHRRYLDYAIEITGDTYIDKFLKVIRNSAQTSSNSWLSFISNRKCPRQFQVKPCIINLISGAQHSIKVEMAYLGDRAITNALINAGKRGVGLTLLVSEKANVGNDLNFMTAHRIVSAGQGVVYLTSKMIHSKMILIDDKTLLMGSANISVLSMSRTEEICVLIQGEDAFVESCRREFSARQDASRLIANANELRRYSSLLAKAQHWIQVLSPI